MAKYKFLDTLEKLLEYDSFLMNESDFPRYQLLAVDTETNGLRFWRDLIIGISISTDADSGVYIPFLKWVPDTTIIKQTKSGEVYENGAFECVWTGKKYPEDVTLDEYQYPEWTATLLERWLTHPYVKLLMHNSVFDCLVFLRSLKLDLTKNLFCDTILLKHVVDQTTPLGLKEVAMLWQEELGYDAENAANKEQLEMGKSIIQNGGVFNSRNKSIWRADLEYLGKYAIADTCLTYGVFEVGMKKFVEQFEDKHYTWFFEDEVMPLCKEVVIPMRNKGVTIDVDYFKELDAEGEILLAQIKEDHAKYLKEKGLLEGFVKGKSVEKAVTQKMIMEHIIAEEGLEYPTSKGKKSLSKAAVKAAYQKEPHWLWTHILEGTPLPYSEEEMAELRSKLYRSKTGSSTPFNIGSDDHLRWLFFERMGKDASGLPKTDSGKVSVKAEILNKFFLKDHPNIIKPILLFKKLKKLHSTYIKPALNLHHNGILYMEMLQYGTATGRFSCSGGYNLQTLPKVEDLSRCPSCGSNNIQVTEPFKLSATIICQDCKAVEPNIIRSSSIKKGFIAPKGYKIVNADYSSLEPRCFGFMSGDAKIKAIYKENLDMYSKVYCDMMGEPYKDLKKAGMGAIRDKFKPVPLGIPYGARPPQVARMMGLTKEVKFLDYDSGKMQVKIVPDVEKGKYYRDLYLNTYRDLANFMHLSRMEANKLGYVETLVGRRGYFRISTIVNMLLEKAGMDYEQFLDMKYRDLKTTYINPVMNKDTLKMVLDYLGVSFVDSTGAFRDWGFIQHLYAGELNLSVNFKIQGLAAHIANRAMLEITRELKQANLDAWVCLQVHDEITLYAKESDVEPTIEIQKRCMETNKYANLLDIPMIADPTVCDNLKDSK